MCVRVCVCVCVVGVSVSVWDYVCFETQRTFEGMIEMERLASTGPKQHTDSHTPHTHAHTPEMDYDATDPKNPVGEVLLRGPCLFDGYYKMPDKTEEVRLTSV